MIVFTIAFHLGFSCTISEKRGRNRLEIGKMLQPLLFAFTRSCQTVS